MSLNKLMMGAALLAIVTLELHVNNANNMMSNIMLLETGIAVKKVDVEYIASVHVSG